MTVKNRDKLLRKMALLPAAIKAEIRAALAKSAQEIVSLAKNLVPVESGELRNSIGWTFGKAPRGSIRLASAAVGDLTVTVYAGDDEAFYARWVEFGTVKTAAQPFFFVSYRALRRRARSRISRETNKALKKVANG